MRILVATCVVATLGCSGTDDMNRGGFGGPSDSTPGQSPPGQGPPNGAPSDPAAGGLPPGPDPLAVHEPPERLDFQNVSQVGEGVRDLILPDPPKSGFRIVFPPRVVQPGEEWQGCIALPVPQFTHRNVYYSRIHTTGALHHSNVMAVDTDPAQGPHPYPSCHAGTGDTIQIVVNTAIEGRAFDMLFANSTQITATEAFAFPPGFGYRLRPEGKEIVADVHYLNTMPEPVRSEIVYDFFTMPDHAVQSSLGVMVVHDQSFEVPAHSTVDVVSDCAIEGGSAVALMPHAHERTIDFNVDVFRPEGMERILAGGKFDGETKIAVFDQPRPLAGTLRQTCRMENNLDFPLYYGTGFNEMCITFGYVTPVEASFAAVKLVAGEPCETANIGQLFE